MNDRICDDRLTQWKQTSSPEALPTSRWKEFYPAKTRHGDRVLVTLARHGARKVALESSLGEVANAACADVCYRRHGSVAGLQGMHGRRSGATPLHH